MYFQTDYYGYSSYNYGGYGSMYGYGYGNYSFSDSYNYSSLTNYAYDNYSYDPYSYSSAHYHGYSYAAPYSGISYSEPANGFNSAHAPHNSWSNMEYATSHTTPRYTAFINDQYGQSGYTTGHSVDTYPAAAPATQPASASVEDWAWQTAATWAGDSVNAAVTAYTGVPMLGEIAGDRLGRNILGAQNESTVGGQIMKAAYDISLDDINEHGLAGGPNSIINQVGLGDVVNSIFG